MCTREYAYIIEELRTIRIEIKQLRQKPISNIKERIGILKKTNNLLKKQNEILLLRQRLLAEGNNNFESKINIPI